MVSPSELLQPCWPPQQLRGELPVLPVSSIASISVCSISALVTCMRRRLDSPPAMLRGSKLSGAGTLWLALTSWIFSPHSHDPIRKESTDSNLICELRPVMTSPLDQSMILTRSLPRWHLTWTLVHQSVVPASSRLGMKSYSLSVSNSRKLLYLGKIISNSNKIRKM
jgi:hypothetical protein